MAERGMAGAGAEQAGAGLFGADKPRLHNRFFAREARVQRWGWIAMGLILAVASIGLFGGGPISRTARSFGEHALTYDRFERYKNQTELEVRIGSGTATPTEIWLDRAYVESIHVEAITPAPSAVRAETERVVFTFDLRPPTTVSFHLSPLTVGALAGRLGVSDGTETAFGHFVFP